MSNQKENEQEMADEQWWDEIEQEAIALQNSCDSLLEDGKRLADKMGLKDDAIISRVFPIRASQRSSKTRVTDRVIELKEIALRIRAERISEEKREVARREIIERLRLTKDDLETLGCHWTLKEHPEELS